MSAKTYAGKPCQHGHGTLRYSANRGCVECVRLKSKERWKGDHNGWKAQRRATYATDGGRKDRRARNLKRNYGLTIEQYDALVTAQGDKCAICAGPPGGSHGRFHVDHCHKTGQIRGLLCHTCNVGLGSFKDSPAALGAAIRYLTDWL